MCRETLYAAGYLGLCPVLYDTLLERGHSPSASMIGSGVAGGVFAAAASHPFDTVKTRMQVCGFGEGGCREAATTQRSQQQPRQPNRNNDHNHSNPITKTQPR